MTAAFHTMGARAATRIALGTCIVVGLGVEGLKHVDATAGGWHGVSARALRVGPTHRACGTTSEANMAVEILKILPEFMDRANIGQDLILHNVNIDGRHAKLHLSAGPSILMPLVWQELLAIDCIENVSRGKARRRDDRRMFTLYFDYVC